MNTQNTITCILAVLLVASLICSGVMFVSLKNTKDRVDELEDTQINVEELKPRIFWGDAVYNTSSSSYSKSYRIVLDIENDGILLKKTYNPYTDGYSTSQSAVTKSQEYVVAESSVSAATISELNTMVKSIENKYVSQSSYRLMY